VRKLWTDEEIQILKDNTNKTLSELCTLLPYRNVNQISSKCKRDSIPFKTQGWNKEELSILRSCEGMNKFDVANSIGTKNPNSVRTKARELGIKLKTNNNLWIKDEDSILEKHSCIDSSFLKIQQEIPHRSIPAISCRFNKLGFKIKPKDYIPIGKTKEYRKTHSKEARYKLIYGITLTKEKGIYTYDSIDWWKWVYYGTPSGAFLKMIPYVFHEDQGELIKLLKYVIENEIGYDTREDLLKLDIKTLQLYKIYFHHSLPSSLYDLLQLIYPNYNFRGYELKNVPLNYWDNIDNCDEYMRHVLIDDFNVSQLSDISRDLPSILTYKHLRDAGYSILAYCITEQHHYKTFYEWVSNLFPNWGLLESDFHNHIGYDNSVLGSKDEVSLYNFLSRDNCFPIIPIPLKTKKYRFSNSEYQENYIPDFIIKNKQRDIIIEYFGLYVENFSKGWILETYHNKTHRKIAFFNGLPEYDFIALYPEDLKNNFEGVSKKLAPFLL